MNRLVERRKQENDNTFDYIKIIDNRYKVISILGKGTFGSVYKAIDNDTGETIAIKEISLRHVKGNLDPEEVYYKNFVDRETGKPICHPNLVCYYGTFRTNKHLYVVMEFIEGQELNQWVYKNRQTLSAGRLINMYRQLSKGLKILHNNGIAHRDLKGQNIMVTNNNVVKIVDYGLTCYLKEQPRCGKISGNLLHFSPAILNRYLTDEKFVVKDDVYLFFDSDVWALGLIFYMMAFNGSYPNKINQMNKETIYEKTSTIKYKDNYNKGDFNQNNFINTLLSLMLYLNDNPKNISGRFSINLIDDVLNNKWHRYAIMDYESQNVNVLYLLGINRNISWEKMKRYYDFVLEKQNIQVPEYATFKEILQISIRNKIKMTALKNYIIDTLEDVDDNMKNILIML